MLDLNENQLTLYRRTILRQLIAARGTPLVLDTLVMGLELANFYGTDAGQCLEQCRALAEGRYVELGRLPENQTMVTVRLLEAGRVLLKAPAGL